MNLKGLINKGDRELDSDAELFIGEQRLSGSRKSAVKSMLLEMGYSKESINERLDGAWSIAGGFKKTDVVRNMLRSLIERSL